MREAFDKAAPIGADYVDGVFHSCNPFSLSSEPFLSRYSGYLDIRKPGHLRFHGFQPGLQFPADRRQAGGLRARAIMGRRTRPGAAAGTTSSWPPACTSSSTTTRPPEPAP